MTTTTDLTYWKDFAKLNDPGNACHYELHNGEVVLVAPPKAKHLRAQARIAELLRNVLEGMVGTEIPYRPAADLQYWVADVAYVPQPLWDHVTAGDGEFPTVYPSARGRSALALEYRSESGAAACAHSGLWSS